MLLSFFTSLESFHLYLLLFNIMKSILAWAITRFTFVNINIFCSHSPANCKLISYTFILTFLIFLSCYRQCSFEWTLFISIHFLQCFPWNVCDSDEIRNSPFRIIIYACSFRDVLSSWHVKTWKTEKILKTNIALLQIYHKK